MSDSGADGRDTPAPAEGGAVSARMSPDRQASHFRRARQAREMEVVEDYVELIADLIDEQGEARLVDVARRLGVSGATVNKMVSRLSEMSLITSEPYRSIFLTEAGRAMAEDSRARHHIVVALLRAVGVDDENAWADAEGIEHHCSPETLAAFERFLEKHGK
jgi:DtxR family manganese transport transcriptional regulator